MISFQSIVKPGAHLQTAWYTLLIIAAFSFSLKSIFFPPWPKASRLSPELINKSLNRAGLFPQMEDTLPPTNSFDFSTSPILRYSLSDGYRLLVFVGVSRTREGFLINTFNRALNSQELINSRPLTGSTYPTLEGFVNQRPAFQTCQFKTANPASTYEVDQTKLPLLIDNFGNVTFDWARKIIGLRPSRLYTCTLITLVSPNTKPIPQRLWNQLLTSTSQVFMP